jgi:TPR repeat protein
MPLRKLFVILTVMVAIADCSAFAEAAPATDCDTYAASPLDPQRKAPGVPFEEMNLHLAIPACEAAVRLYPTSDRMVFQLGRAYSKNSDFVHALVQFREAADQGHALAQYNLGVMYERAQGVKKDDARAVLWYRKAAEQGFASAQFNLGNMYRAGWGVPRDFAEGLKWLRKAAEQGNIRASLVVGLMYADGQGAAKDYTESVKWLRVAADQGDAEAQRLLGVMYEFGGGVPKNLAEAAEWYGKAANQGDAEAKSKLAAMARGPEPNIEALGPSLTPAIPRPPPAADTPPPYTQTGEAHSLPFGGLRWKDGYIDNGKFVRAIWQTIEADNGAVYALDLKSIVQMANGLGATSGVTVGVYVVEGELFDPNGLRSFIFDCAGHFQIFSGAGFSPMRYAPPRSIAAKIGILACASVKAAAK